MAAMSKSAKRIAMLAIAAATVALVDQLIAPGPDSGDVVGSAVKKRSSLGSAAMAATPERAAVRASVVAGVDFDRLDKRREALADDVTQKKEESDLFGPVSWQPPATLAGLAPPPPPPRPVAPPFPYTYFGGLTEDGVRTAFFMKGDRVIPVKAGDVIDAVYRVDKMNGKQMELTYVPLNESLVVPFGGGQ